MFPRVSSSSKAPALIEHAESADLAGAHRQRPPRSSPVVGPSPFADDQSDHVTKERALPQPLPPYDEDLAARDIEVEIALETKFP